MRYVGIGLALELHDQAVSLVIVPSVALFGAALDEVKRRWSSDVDVAIFDQLLHVAEEERQR